MVWLQKSKKKKTILFLCTGDTCRGPMAAGYMRKLLEERNLREIEVRSAGVMTATGLLSTPEAIQLLDTVGVDLRRHRSSQLTPEMIRKADLILGMTPFHVQFAVRMTDEAKNKTFLFKEFTGSDPKNYQITDPMGHTLEVYKRVFREIRQACEFLAESEVITGKPSKPKTKTPKSPPTRKRKAPSKARSKAADTAKPSPSKKKGGAKASSSKSKSAASSGKKKPSGKSAASTTKAKATSRKSSASKGKK